MKDHETPEAARTRAEQEDPIIMYLIVHESLGMSTGKTAAQCAHASQMLTMEYFEMKSESSKLQKLILNPPVSNLEFGVIADELSQKRWDKYREDYRGMAPKLSIFGEWINQSFRKVVLRASDKEWTKLKEEFKHSMVMVVDAGLTEIPCGSETVIGLWPVRKSQVSKTVKKLQVLK